jgi:dTDP-4-dehydrorhamnose 3,5-epimerase
MKFTPLKIPDVILIQPRIFEDPRGYFYEVYNQSLFAANGIKDDFVQDNLSFSSKGVLRGLHYQAPPKAQSKLVRVLKGSILDVVVDIREGSETFGQHVAGVLTAANKEMLYVPIGFAHGFCALEDNTEVMYKVSDFYSPAHELGVLWNDPALKIDWPKMGNFVISDKDKKFPLLKQAVTL